MLVLEDILLYNNFSKLVCYYLPVCLFFFFLFFFFEEINNWIQLQLLKSLTKIIIISVVLLND